MRIFPGTALAACLVCGPVSAEPPTLNMIAASEFGNGLGAGLEFGETNALVLGLGSGHFGVGATGSGSLFGQFSPGVAIGFRRYLGSWFVGPTAVANYNLTSTGLGQGLRLSSLLDVGYRWTWKSNPDWNTKLGLGAGVELNPRDGSAGLAAALTISVGFRL
jgi:hypothetical protein